MKPDTGTAQNREQPAKEQDTDTEKKTPKIKRKTRYTRNAKAKPNRQT